MYELLLDGRLCWLYFDIEYSREANPDLEPEAVMAAFHEILESFGHETLDLPLLRSAVIELDSSGTSHRRVGVQPEPILPLALPREVRQASSANAAA